MGSTWHSFNSSSIITSHVLNVRQSRNQAKQNSKRITSTATTRTYQTPPRTHSPHHLLQHQASQHRHQPEVHLDHPLGRNERRWAAAEPSLHRVPSLVPATPAAGAVCAALGESRGREVVAWTSWLRHLSPPLICTPEEHRRERERQAQRRRLRGTGREGGRRGGVRAEGRCH